jgi:hypothetical protein
VDRLEEGERERKHPIVEYKRASLTREASTGGMLPGSEILQLLFRI